MTNMRWTRRVGMCGMVIAGMLSAAGCGSERPASVMAPSIVGAPASLAAADDSNSIGAQTGTGTTTSGWVTVTGLVSGYSCPTLRFKLGTYTIKTDAKTSYSVGSCASIQTGTVLMFTGTKLSVVSVATNNVAPVTTNEDVYYYASAITLKSEQTPPPPAPTPAPTPPPSTGQTDVAVSSLIAGTKCPDLQFKSGTYVLKTSSSTKYEGGGCTGIKAGMTIAIGGAKLTDTTVIVSSVTFKTPVEETEPVETDVVVSSLVGDSECPYLQFKAGDDRFVTSKTTRYDYGQCDLVKPGSKLRISGERRKSDSKVLVSTVLFAQDQAQPVATVPVSGEAVVTEVLSESKCPALSFKFGVYTVNATAPTTINMTASTVYDAGSCSDINVGAKVTFTGEKHDDGSIVVSRAAVKTAAPPKVVESVFTVSAVSTGSKCPALQFAVAGYYLSTDEKTEYVDGMCNDIKARTKVSVRGIVTGEKTVLATRVAFPE